MPVDPALSGPGTKGGGGGVSVSPQPDLWVQLGERACGLGLRHSLLWGLPLECEMFTEAAPLGCDSQMSPKPC